MPAIRGITISVGYADLLRVTLVRNLRHLTECLVVTTPEDEATKAVAASVPGVRILETDAFTRHGARFNKGLAMEEGFDALGRHGFVLIWDADILLPDVMPVQDIKPNAIHGCRRRILENPESWRPDLNWNVAPHAKDGGPIGFFQLFHAEYPALASKRPWYDVSFAHAGGGDAYFIGHWDAGKRVVLPFDVLHLGLPDRNWFGTHQEGRDLMARYVTENNWRRGIKYVEPGAVERAGELPGRIEVPGYAPSTYELPFERRAQQQRK